MTRLLREILKAYLYSSTVLFLLSLSSFSPQVSAFLQSLSFPALLVLCCLKLVSPPKASKSLLFPWLVALLIWFAIQQTAIMLEIPPFEVPSNWRAWIDFLALFSTAASYALVSEEIFSDREDLYAFLKFFVFSAGITAVYFIFLFYTAGVAVEKIQPPFVLLEHLGPLAAFSLQPNNLVDLFVPPFFLGLSLVFYHHRRKLHFSDPSRAYTEIILNLCFACVLLAGIFYTKSRAGIIAFFGGLVFFAILFALAQRRRKSAWKIVALVFVAGVIFLSTLGMKDVFRELMTLKETFTREAQIKGLRSLTMGASWQLITEKGFWGVGLGNFPMGWLLFHKAPFTVYPYRSYNDLLWFWAEAGLPGVIIFAGLLLKTFISGIRNILKSQSSFIAYLSAACLASVSVFVLHAMVDPTLYVNTLLWEIAIVLGAAGALRHLEVEETRDKRLGISKPKHPVFRVFAAVFLLLVAAPVTYFSSLRLIALETLSPDELNVEKLERTARFEITDSFYPQQLAQVYAQQYAQEPANKALFDKAVKAMDSAIDRDPFNVSLYRNRADLFANAGDIKGSEQSFKMMEERLPNFYLGYIASMSFYLEQSLKEKDPVKSNRFKAQALRHYLRTLELNPKLIKYYELYPSLSEDAQQTLQTLLEEKSLS